MEGHVVEGDYGEDDAGVAFGFARLAGECSTEGKMVSHFGPIRLGMNRKMFSSVISSPVSRMRGVPAVPFDCDPGGDAVLVAASVVPLDGELLLLLVAMVG